VRSGNRQRDRDEQVRTNTGRLSQHISRERFPPRIAL
jgi:hypothetical protein